MKRRRENVIEKRRANLKIKRFMGESRNVIMIQIFVALISYVTRVAVKGMN
jgi:hypothetical protein